MDCIYHKGVQHGILLVLESLTFTRALLEIRNPVISGFPLEIATDRAVVYSGVSAMLHKQLNNLPVSSVCGGEDRRYASGGISCHGIGVILYKNSDNLIVSFPYSNKEWRYIEEGSFRLNISAILYKQLDNLNVSFSYSSIER